MAIICLIASLHPVNIFFIVYPIKVEENYTTKVMNYLFFVIFLYL